MLESAWLYLQMNNDNRWSWDCSPHVLLHLKQIYGLTKAWGKAVILNMKKNKIYLSLIWHKDCTQECISIILLKTVCKSDHKQPRYKKSCNPISFHLRTPCCDPRDPAAILPRSSRPCRDNHNTCFLAINRHCFLDGHSDPWSQVNCLIFADRHFFLVGPVNILANEQR